MRSIDIEPLSSLKDIKSFCEGRMKLLNDTSNSAYLAYRDVKYLVNQHIKISNNLEIRTSDNIPNDIL